MIQASLSPSKAATGRRVFDAGPLRIHVSDEPGPLRDLIASTLSLYGVPWKLTDRRSVHLSVDVVPEAAPAEARGNYLQCAQMLVDAVPGGLRATTRRGAELEGAFLAGSEHWRMTVPDGIVQAGWWPEIEDLISLVVTTGWRRLGWVPLHAAGLVRKTAGVLVCAMSRGGKTTFSLAMARRGWRVAGDDKLLLGHVDGQRVLGAVKHMLNVDPVAAGWFPELGDLTGLPLYSEWSPKRRVQLARVFPSAPTESMIATHLISLVRVGAGSSVRVHDMTTADAIGTLLRQTVVPTERAVARQITGAVVQLAQSLRALRVEVPDGIYSDRSALEPVDAALESRALR